MGAEKNYTPEESYNEIATLRIEIEREKEARTKAEALLENRANSLYNINQKLHEQYLNASKSNQEIDYLLKITNLESKNNDTHDLIANFLGISSMLLWTEASFAFRCSKEFKNLLPIASYIISPLAEERIEHENKFLSEQFVFLEQYYDLNEPFVYSNFSNEISQINPNYYQLNHSYLFPIEVDREEKYFIWLTFANSVELNPRTMDLVARGINQLKGTLQRHKSRFQLVENYKKLKEVKSQLIQSEKMASLGTISAGIAHEINNPLSFLLTNSEVLKVYLVSIINYIHLLESPDKDIKEIQKLKNNIDYILQDTPLLMNESLEGIDRIKEIVNGLRTFSRADDGEIKDFPVDACIETSLRLVSNELKHKCKIVKNLNSKSHIKGADGQIIQVLTNLLVNSAQAIEEFGLIEITTRDEAETVIISVKDSGKGISEENLEQLFTPFFTTKPTGQGTGLGLSISYGIIKKHKGDIIAESKLGVGTTFHIILPISRGANA